MLWCYIFFAALCVRATSLFGHSANRLLVLSVLPLRGVNASIETTLQATFVGLPAASSNP